MHFWRNRAYRADLLRHLRQLRTASKLRRVRGAPVKVSFPNVAARGSRSCSRFCTSFVFKGRALMSKASVDADEILQHASPVVHQTGHEIQPYGHLIRMPIALSESACKESVDNLNQLLADTMTLRDSVQEASLASIRADVSPTPPAVRQALRGAGDADRRDRRTHPVARWREHRHGGSTSPRRHLFPGLPKGRESVPVQISRLLHAHEIVLKEAHTMARLASEREDDGTNDLLVSDVIRTNELQVWFVAEHVIDTPVVRGD